ncbi:MAG: hypothetical protein ACREEC_07755, partial [Thermoplasmata archaeon]
ETVDPKQACQKWQADANAAIIKLNAHGHAKNLLTVLAAVNAAKADPRFKSVQPRLEELSKKLTAKARTAEEKSNVKILIGEPGDSPKPIESQAPVPMRRAAATYEDDLGHIVDENGDSITREAD